MGGVRLTVNYKRLNVVLLAPHMLSPNQRSINKDSLLPQQQKGPRAFFALVKHVAAQQTFQGDNSNIQKIQSDYSM